MSKGRLVARIAPVPTVTPELEDVLFSLFEEYYDRVPRGVFHRDFREKQWIILLTDSVSNEIKGFSTLMLLDVAAEDIQLVVAFSGDTIIDREYWGEQRLALGQKAEAIHAYERAADVAFDSRTMRFNVAVLLYRCKELERARVHALAAREIDPWRPGPYRLLARLARVQGRLGEEKYLLKRADDIEGSP